MTRHSATPEKPAAKVVDIFTDGACSGNPGPGGWGALLRWDGHEKVPWRRARDHQQPHGADGGDQGAGEPEAPVKARPHTDSQYVMKGAKYRGEWTDLCDICELDHTKAMFLGAT